ncbi:hypothetical protein FE257_005396 [Aspergillus nanangensis]|uniref:Ornithine aminotransferase n=1 Tax=Aspergillus nanangensis TaxID=2582783 RepID=A0AAD4CQG2_ASPNN|nr:hypothetical protein FE257_005396 [Aspergillus nanangensis]
MTCRGGFGDLDLPERPSEALTYILWQERVRGGFAAFPIAIDRADDYKLYDVDGKGHIDMISQFAVMNFGYSNRKIIDATVTQIKKSPLINTGFINPLYGEFAERITRKFGFDSIATMSSGSEALDSAIKVARKWAYIKKGVSMNEAWVLTTDCCYHGVALATMSLSNNIADNFGQHLPNVGPYAPTSGKLLEYGDLDVLTEAFRVDGQRIAAFIVEPIQGLAGTRIPPPHYLKSVQDLCREHNVLFICDEVQTGYGRTGTDLAFQAEPGVKPDLLTLGKAVTGGYYPMSVIMGRKEVMDVLEKYEVAGTFSGGPVPCAAALATLDVLEEGNFPQRAQRLGEVLAETIDRLAPPHILEHRGWGRGLFQTLVLDETVAGVTGRRVAALSAHRGVLVGNSANKLRFSPPLTISEADLVKGITIVVQALRDVSQLGDFPGSDFLN